MPEGFDEELRQGLRRREEGGARSDLVMEGAVLEEVWGGEGGLSAGRGVERGERSVSRERSMQQDGGGVGVGQGCLKGSAGKSDCC